MNDPQTSRVDEDKAFDRLMREKELSLKERDLDLKERELDLKANDFWRGWVVNALTVGVLAGVVGLLGNILTSYAQLQQEKRKDEAALILDAMKASTIEERCTNLFFLDSAGLAKAGTSADAVCTGTAVYRYFARLPASKKWYSKIVTHAPLMGLIAASVAVAWVVWGIGLWLRVK